MATSRQLAIFAEDQLTAAVLLKCVREILPNFGIARREVKHGRGNVQRDMPAYTKLAAIMPVVVGVDLDQDLCAPTLLRAWGVLPTSKNRLVRVAVREVEAWVLADTKRVAKFIGATSDEIGTDPDSLPDPKRFLLELARKNAPRDLKADLVPRNFNKYPRIGPAYNLRMSAFVENRWRPAEARKRSDSLHRALKSLEAL